MRVVLLSGLVAMLGVAACAEDAPTVSQLIDEFRAVDWDSRAKMAKPDPADEAWRVRVRVEHALIGMAPAPVEELLALLEDQDRHVRALGALCLGAVGAAAALESLKQMLASDGDGIVRVYVAEALGRLGDASAVDALTAAEGGEDRNVAYAAHVAKERLVDGPDVGASLSDAALSAAEIDALATPKVGEEAPEIELLSASGEPVTLSSLRGKPVAVLFQLADW